MSGCEPSNRHGRSKYRMNVSKVRDFNFLSSRLTGSEQYNYCITRYFTGLWFHAFIISTSKKYTFFLLIAPRHVSPFFLLNLFSPTLDFLTHCSLCRKFEWKYYDHKLGWTQSSLCDTSIGLSYTQFYFINLMIKFSSNKLVILYITNKYSYERVSICVSVNYSRHQQIW